MKSKIIFFIVNSALQVLSFLPLPINHFLAGVLGYCFYIFKTKAYKISLINIRLCFPELSQQQQQQLLKDSLVELGKNILELGFVWKKPVDEVLSKITVSGMSPIKQLIEQHSGVIILTPHLGCWEIAGLYMAKQLPFTTLYQIPKVLAVDPVIKTARERSGTHLVKADKRGLSSLLKALKAGKATGILPDQTPKDTTSGLYAPFFSQPALTITLVSALAKKTQAKIFIGYAKRLEQGQGYDFVLYPGDDDLYSDDNLIAATALNRQVEQLIRECPQQYLWSYKRFKNQGIGIKSIYL